MTQKISDTKKENKKNFWSKVIGEDWYNFYPELWESEYMENVINYLKYQYLRATVYPPMGDVFRAFRLCPYNELKVLILGQDPYPDGSATGLAFANNPTDDISPSLRKITECIERELYDGMLLQPDYSLEQWAQQGVLLLNTSLTVERYKIGAHYQVWKQMIDILCIKLSESNPGLHVCLWGNKAKSFKDRFKNVYIYEYVHPAYAARQNIDWKCTHFKEINMKLREQNGEEAIIAW